MRLLPGSLLLLLAGCSMVPPMPVVDAGLPEHYRVTTPLEVERPAVQPRAAHTLGWVEMFGDPRLRALIQQALQHNRDLRVALSNVEAARAQYGVERSAQWPRIDARAGVGRERVAESLSSSAVVAGAHSAGVSLSAFEIDLFGRVRALSEAAQARYLASAEGAQAVQISLIAAVADAYLEERLATEQLHLTETTLADWRQSLALARLLKDAKQNSGLDVAQAEGQVASAEADLEGRLRDLALARHALVLLLGGDVPAALPEGLPLAEQPILTRLPPGLPSDVLLQRPDLRQAEQALRAANADLGAARAAFFPTLSLTASLGYASPALGGLFAGSQQAWSFAPQLSLPLFDHGRLAGNRDLAEARREIAVAQYEKAIQTAFREVADGLAGSATLDRQLLAQERVVASAERRRALSNLRYRVGQDSRLELLDAQRQAYAAQQGLLSLRRAVFKNALTLYKALGGGLVEGAAPVQGTPPA